MYKLSKGHQIWFFDIKENVARHTDGRTDRYMDIIKS